MAKQQKKQSTASHAERNPSVSLPETRKIPAANIEQELASAMEAEDYYRALDVIDNAPRWMQKTPEFQLTHASVLASIEEYDEALVILRELERKNPRFLAIYLPLALIYMTFDFQGLALRAAKRGLSDPELDPESRTLLEKAVAEATEAIQNLAQDHGLSFEAMQRAMTLNEQAEMALMGEKYSEVDYFTKEAIKVAPNWNPPYNNRARTLYFSGRMIEAITITESVLNRDTENAFALNNIITFYIGINQPEKAQHFVDRLAKLSGKFPINTPEIELAISTLALAENTSALWKIAQKYLDEPSETLVGRSWFCLAVAAIRGKKWNEALVLMNKIDVEERSEAANKILAELEASVKAGRPQLGWMPPAYPVVDMFLSEKVTDEWEALIESIGNQLTPAKKRKLDNFIQRHPFVLTTLKHMLWGELSHSMALAALGLLEIPEVDEEILRFAFSQSGNYDARLHALFLMRQLGRYPGPSVLKIWDEEQDSWREVELSTQQIGDVQANAQPKTMALIERAHSVKDPQEAIRIMRKAVELEPTSPIAVFNLGVLLVQNGQEEEGTAFLYHSVEVDPNYTYGHASIALTEAEKGNEREAVDHLEKVNQADVISPDTAVLVYLAGTVLALAKRDVKAARQSLNLAAQIMPDHRLIESFEERVRLEEELHEKFSFIFEYQRKSAQRAHEKEAKNPLRADMSVKECLEMHTKDMLTGSARFLRLSTTGKKAQLISAQAKYLLDAEALQVLFTHILREKEREALIWLLEPDGIRPWNEFIHKFGNDATESTAWHYNEPESIPGRLKMSGLLFSGVLDGQQVAFIPADLRPLLQEIIGQHGKE